MVLIVLLGTPFFEFAASTEATETATDGKTDIHIFRYNGAVWQEVGRTLNLAES